MKGFTCIWHQSSYYFKKEDVTVNFQILMIWYSDTIKSLIGSEGKNRDGRETNNTHAFLFGLSTLDSAQIPLKYEYS